VGVSVAEHSDFRGGGGGQEIAAKSRGQPSLPKYMAALSELRTKDKATMHGARPTGTMPSEPVLPIRGS
jgi:hypothetical protein